MTSMDGHLQDLQELRALSEQFKARVSDFFERWREKCQGEISGDDLVQINLEWLDLMALKYLIGKEAQRLGVDTGNN